MGLIDFIGGLVQTLVNDENQDQYRLLQEQIAKNANNANLAMTDMTNSTNRLNVAETNSTQRSLAELAYRRSLPVNQVSDLVAAGMSKSAALNKLAGGGVYSPPPLQSATAQAPPPYEKPNISPKHLDLSSIQHTLSSIPSDVQQYQLRAQALDDARRKANIELSEERRRQELHEYNLWKEQYGKDAATQLDAVSTDIAQRLFDSGKTTDDFKSFDSMVHSLGVDKSDGYQKLPHIARTQLETGFNEKFAALRAERDQANKDNQSQDSHDLAEIAKGLQNIELKYADRNARAQYIKLMRESEKVLADGRLVDANSRRQVLENIIRESGIDTERVARAIEQEVRYLESLDEHDIANKRITANSQTLGVWNQFRLLLRDIGDILHGLKLPTK